MSTALTVFLLVVTSLLVVAAVLAAVAGVWLGRLALRWGRLAGRHARSGWSTARAALPSEAQAVRVQRARLDRASAATTDAWVSGRRMLDRAARRRFADSHDVLTRTARQLAYELSIAAADNADPVHRASWLADLRFRVDAYVTACGAFRQGILLAAGAYGDAAGVAATAVVLDLNPVSGDDDSVRTAWLPADPSVAPVGGRAG